MSASHAVTTGGSVVGVALATADILAPDASWMERLGTVGVLVVAGYFLIRWLMGELAKKDAQLVVMQAASDARIAAISAQALKASEDNMRTLVAELRDGYEVKRKMADALSELTSAIRGQR